jgi:hypothetical protein
MFTYTLIAAFSLLFISVFLKGYLINVALCAIWFAVIVMCGQAGGNWGIEAMAGIIMIYSIIRIFRVRRETLA